jgi:hypothetical protein
MTFILKKISETVLDTVINRGDDFFPFIRFGLPLEEQNRYIKAQDFYTNIFERLPYFMVIGQNEVPYGNGGINNGGLQSSSNFEFGKAVDGLEVRGDSVFYGSSSLAGFPFRVFSDVENPLFEIAFQQPTQLQYKFNFGATNDNNYLGINTNVYDVNNVNPAGIYLYQNGQVVSMVRAKTGTVGSGGLGVGVDFGQGKLTGNTGVNPCMQVTERFGLVLQDFSIGIPYLHRLFVATPDMSTESGFGEQGYFDIGTKARPDDPVNNLYFDRMPIRYTASSHLFRVDRYSNGVGNLGYDALLLQESDGASIMPTFDTSVTPVEVYAVGQLIQLYRAEIQIVSLFMSSDIVPVDGSTFYALTNASDETHTPTHAAHLGDNSIMVLLVGAGTVQPFFEVEASGVIVTPYGYMFHDFIVALFVNGNEVAETRRQYQIYANTVPFALKHRLTNLVPNSVIEVRICSVNQYVFNVESFTLSVISN